VFRDECLKLRRELAVPAQRELRIDPVLDCDESQLLESTGRGSREPLGREVGERLAAPEVERSAKKIGRMGRTSLGERRASALDQFLELVRIDDVVVSVEGVSGCLPLEPRSAIRVQLLPQAGDIDLEGVLGGGGRVLRPERLRQVVDRDDAPCVDEQGCKERALAGTPERQRPPLVEHLEWSQDPKLHAAAALPQVRYS